MKKKFVEFTLPGLICLFLVSPCFAGMQEAINFKLTCPDTDLLVGETTTVTVWAWANSVYAVAGNGLDTWQMDIGVDVSGVIRITDTAGAADISLIAPNPDTMWSGWSSFNSPTTGSASEIAVCQVTVGAASETGVGGYSEIFSFQIEALSEGTAAYSIDGNVGGIFAFLADGEWFENTAGADGGIYFDAAASDNVFNVTPEPCSLLIMSGLTVLALRRRRSFKKESAWLVRNRQLL